MYVFIFLLIFIYLIYLLNYFYVKGNYDTPASREKRIDWYHGTLSRPEAVNLLYESGNKDGTFLVRFSDRSGGTYVLTVMYHNQDFHYQIQKKVINN